MTQPTSHAPKTLLRNFIGILVLQLDLQDESLSDFFVGVVNDKKRVKENREWK